MLERLAGLGFETVGSVEDYRGIYLLCHARGPEEIVVELAEEIGDPSRMLDPAT